MIKAESKNTIDLNALPSYLLLQMKDYSVLSLILANLVPLFGILAFGWNLFSIIFLYWLENVVIGFYNVFKILYAKGEESGVKKYTLKAGNVRIPVTSSVNTYGHGRVVLSIFFIYHYGIFTIGHMAFVFTFFGSLRNPSENYLYPFMILFLSHGLSFFQNYLGKKEYLKISPGRQLFQPYSRVVVMHLVIMLGGFIAMAFGAPMLAVMMLIALKTVLDLYAHIKEHDVSALGVVSPRPEPSVSF